VPHLPLPRHGFWDRRRRRRAFAFPRGGWRGPLFPAIASPSTFSTIQMNSATTTGSIQRVAAPVTSLPSPNVGDMWTEIFVRLPADPTLLDTGFPAPMNGAFPLFRFACVPHGSASSGCLGTTTPWFQFCACSLLPYALPAATLYLFYIPLQCLPPSYAYLISSNTTPRLTFL